MSAKEMFEELGFELDITEYKSYKPDYNFVDEMGNALIFDLEDKKIEIATCTTIKTREPKKFCEAINQQCKELGWLDE